jgi:hypothetical protein
MSSSLNGNNDSSLDDVAMNGLTCLSTFNGVDNRSPVTHGVDNGLPTTNGVNNGLPSTHGVDNGLPTTHGVDNGLPTTNGVVPCPSLGCKIDRVEMRGVTLQQLEGLLAEIEAKCKNREMTSDTEELLLVDDVTFHHIRENIIIPRTKEKQWSYIETIATSEQKTTWCVVFGFGQSFKDIVTVLKQHSKDRQLKSTDCYWMHVRLDDYIFFSLFLSVIPFIKYLFQVLADNPWSLPGDINDNFSAFPRAMKLAKGTICVIDNNCTILKHLWSLMDIYLAVQRKKEDIAYMLDFYTAQNEFAMGLTDGLIHNDYKSLVKKSDREAKFPLQIIKKAFNVDVKTADYNRDIFIKNFVMNAITGIPRNDKPIENDVKYDDFNKILGGIFVSSSLDRLLRENPNEEEVQNYLKALQSYAPTSISLDLSNRPDHHTENSISLDLSNRPDHHTENSFSNFVKNQLLNFVNKYFEAFKLYAPTSISLDLRNRTQHLISEKCVNDVFESLPSSIQRVHINLTNNRIAKNQLFSFVNKLKQLTALRIYGVALEATEVKKLLGKHHKSITSLALVDCSIKDDDIETIIAEIQQCQKLEELDLSENTIKEEGLRHIDDMLEKLSHTIKLRLFKIDAVQLTNPFKRIMPYHFSSVS